MYRNFKITVTDLLNNPLDGIAVTVTPLDNLLNNSNVLAATTDQNGIAEFGTGTIDQDTWDSFYQCTLTVDGPPSGYESYRVHVAMGSSSEYVHTFALSKL